MVDDSAQQHSSNRDDAHSMGTAPAPVVSVILAGGKAERLGGIDKTRLHVGADSVLQRVLDAAPAGERIVVGPHDENDPTLTHGGVRFVREDPPGGGPLAAVGRAVQELAANPSTTTVLLLGGDMPFLDAATLRALQERSAKDGRIHALRDESGRTQYLAAAWPLGLLRDGLDAVRESHGGVAGVGLHRLYTSAPESVLHDAGPGESLDIDTPADLAAARARTTLCVALAQIIVPEDTAAARAEVEHAAQQAAEAGARLLVLPEATLTPFGTNLRAVARDHSDAFSALLEELAERHDLTIVAGSFTPAVDGRVHNTVHVRGRATADYRKIHLFDAFGSRESDTVAPGDQLVHVDVDSVRIGIATCYDVRFPDQIIRLAQRGADVIVLPLAWGDGPGKEDQLRLLLRARALDATVFVLAADQAPPPDYAGSGPRGVGHSAVIAPDGRVLAELGRAPGMLIHDLDLDLVRTVRRALPVLEHQRAL